MKRNQNIETFRAVAIIYMLLYHFMVSMPKINQPNRVIYIESFGQFALITFFVLSGYGTFCLLKKMELSGQIRFGQYIKRRLLAVLPQYYLCIGILLLLSPKITYLQGSGWIKVFENMLLLQNFDGNSAINGVTWTMAVLFQLYIIAIPLYKLLKKYKSVAWVIVMVFMFCLKRCIYMYIGSNEIEAIYYVITSIRIPFTTIGLFFSGMFAAFISDKFNNKEYKNNNVLLVTVCVCMVVMYHIGFSKYAVYTGGLWQNSWTACIWQEIIAVWVAIILIIASKLQFTYETKAGRCIQFVAKYEYGIYLWHMVLFSHFQSYELSWFSWLSEKYPFAIVLIMILVAVCVGYFSSIVSNNEKYLKVFKYLK